MLLIVTARKVAFRHSAGKRHWNDQGISEFSLKKKKKV